MRIAAALLLLLQVGVASAQGTGKPEEPAPPPAGTPAPSGMSAGGMASGMEGRSPTDVLRFEDPLLIEGRVQKPQGLHLLRREATAFSDLIPEDHFLEKIFEAVESEPF